MTSPRAVRITLAILLGLIGYVAWRIGAPYAEALLTGVAVAAVFYPMHDWLRRHLRRPSLAAFLSTVIAVVVVLIPLVLITATIVRELRQGVQALTSDGFRNNASSAWEWVDGIAMRFGSSAAEIEDAIRSRMQESVAALLRGTVTAAGAATGGILQIIVTIGAIHYGFRNGPAACDRLLAYSPLGRERTETLLHTTYEMVRASFYGIIAVAGAQGLLVGVAAWIAGLPSPMLWGVATAIASVLPLIGSALVWIPGTVVLATSGHAGMAIFFFAWGAGLVSNVDNVVRPLIVMASLPVSGLIVFVALLGGVQAFGLIGIFLGPVALAVGVAVLKMVRDEIQRTEQEP
ncbi:MAG: AI-2E family transporter [Acidobacteriota bacterium]